jgi:hypothetical protein
MNTNALNDMTSSLARSARVRTSLPAPVPTEGGAGREFTEKVSLSRIVLSTIRLKTPESLWAL